jgi:cytochrome c nitrite reductase small subunit
MESPIRNTLLLGVALGLFLGLGGYTFIYSKGYSYLTNNPAACANCHVMQAQYDAWLKSSHRSAATCNDCHTPHNILGKYAVKANNGFWHSFYFTTGWYPDTIEITKFGHQVTENACRHCTKTSPPRSMGMWWMAKHKVCSARAATHRSDIPNLLPPCPIPFL